MIPPETLGAPSRLAVVASVVLLVSGASGAERVSFNRDVRPILSDNCFHCHGPGEKDRKGGLRLDVRDAALKGGESGAAFVPGKPQESELMTRILSHDPDDTYSSVAKQARALRNVSDDLGALTAQVQSQTPSKDLQVAETQLLSATEKLADEASHNADVLDEAVTAAQGNDVGAVNRGKLRTIRALTALPAMKQMNRALIVLIDRLRLPRTQYDIPGGRDLDDADSSTAT